MNVRGIPRNCKCPYRSREWTGTGILGVFLLVWVPSMDPYEHSSVLEGAPRGLFQRLAAQEDCP